MYSKLMGSCGENVLDTWESHGVFAACRTAGCFLPWVNASSGTDADVPSRETQELCRSK